MSGRGKAIPENNHRPSREAAGDSLFSTLFNVAAIRGK
jgi:hypothetical protein